MKFLSVLIPSLYRFDRLKQSIKSWQETGPGQFELLVRLHISDQESCDRWKELKGDYPLTMLFGRDKYPGEGNAFLWNELRPLANGIWLQFWSDDMVIKGDWANELVKVTQNIAHPESHRLNGSTYLDDVTGPTPFVHREKNADVDLWTVPDRVFAGCACRFLKGVEVYHNRVADLTLPASEY